MPRRVPAVPAVMVVTAVSAVMVVPVASAGPVARGACSVWPVLMVWAGPAATAVWVGPAVPAVGPARPRARPAPRWIAVTAATAGPAPMPPPLAVPGRPAATAGPAEPSVTAGPVAPAV